jgi:hypothetical protein
LQRSQLTLAVQLFTLALGVRYLRQAQVGGRIRGAIDDAARIAARAHLARRWHVRSTRGRLVGR